MPLSPPRGAATSPSSGRTRPRVLLLHDEYACESRIDTSDVLAEAAHLAAALDALGYEPVIQAVGLDLAALADTIASAAPVAVFNLVESLAGRAQLIHFVPSLLETSGTPYTGCPSSAQYFTSNKLLAKRQLRAAVIPTPEVWAPQLTESGPWIVKSVWEHASLGIDDSSVVARGSDVPAALQRRRGEFGGEWFAERFIGGRELNVALIAEPSGVRPLPIAEILFEEFPPDKPRIVGYAAKWQDESFEYRHTPRTFAVEPALARRATDAALACWRLFALQGYARVDFRVDSNGGLWVLEVNANPCLSPDAGFAAALQEGGIRFADAVSWLLEDALHRAGGSSAAARDHVQYP